VRGYVLAAGVNTLRVEPDRATLDERLAKLGKLIELVREVEVLPRLNKDSPLLNLRYQPDLVLLNI
jgi:hypothetical protein